jgi:hypothetical protein
MTTRPGSPTRSFDKPAFEGVAALSSPPPAFAAVTSTDSVFRVALLNQYNLILLGGAVLFSLVLVNPLPALVAAAAEFLFLTVGIALPPVRRWAQHQVEAKHAAARVSHARQEVQSLEQSLEPLYANRIATLGELSRRIRALASERGFSRSLGGEGDRLSDLQRAFTQLAAQHQRLSRILTETPTAPIAAQVTGIEAALAQERDETVRLSLSRALALGHRRLKQQVRHESQRRAIGVKLKTVEMSFDYLRSHILAGGSEADLHEEIDQVLATAAWSSLIDGEGEGSVSKSMPGALITSEIRAGSSAQLSVPPSVSGARITGSLSVAPARPTIVGPSEAVTPGPAAISGGGKLRRP